MEKLLFKPYDKEHMRMAMLRHEATFKEQVYELHRLYQIQKILMKNSTTCSQRKNNIIDSDQRQMITAVDYDIINKINIGDESGGGGVGGGHVAVEVVIEERDIELTLGPTSYSQRGVKPERPVNSDCDRSFSSSSTGSSQMNKTLRATASNNHNKSNINNNNIDNVDEELRLKHPPWLFQVLSLNMT